jgi:dethiobiotin synthetase
MIRFVSGTDTGVGKTIACAVLAHRARADGNRVRYVKPVQTGLAGAEPGDAAFVAEAAGVEAAELFRFADPLAPGVAAERAGTTIDFTALVAGIGALSENCDLLLVEGAGGLLVPIAGEKTMADLASDIEAELVVATRPGLGTLNHTALTLEAANARGIPVAGLVVCGWPARPGLAERTNLNLLKAMAPVLAVIRRIRGVSVDDSRTGPLKNALERGTAIVRSDV